MSTNSSFSVGNIATTSSLGFSGHAWMQPRLFRRGSTYRRAEFVERRHCTWDFSVVNLCWTRQPLPSNKKEGEGTIPALTHISRTMSTENDRLLSICLGKTMWKPSQLRVNQRRSKITVRQRAPPLPATFVARASS